VVNGTAHHEARHAAAGLLLGLPTKHARADYPSTGTKGSVTFTVDPSDGEQVRALAIATLVGYMDRWNWPPSWPQQSGRRDDESDLASLVSTLRLDERSWTDLCDEARGLAARSEFKRLVESIAPLLESGRILGRAELKHIHQLVGDKVEHALKAATALVSEKGEFSAVAAAWSTDRGQERIARGAFLASIARWRLANRPVPLHWDHKSTPEYVVGHVDSMRETSEGLRVTGRLDLEESSVAREAWRAMRSGAIGLSFGYLVTKSHSEGDVRVLDEVVCSRSA
jgi:HK97 family phage prohead protease